MGVRDLSSDVIRDMQLNIDREPNIRLDYCYDMTLPDITWPIALSGMRTSITLRHGLGLRHGYLMKK